MGLSQEVQGEGKGIHGYTNLESTLANHKVDEVIIADTIITKDQMDGLTDDIMNTRDGVAVKVVPELYDLISTRLKVSSVYGLSLIHVQRRSLKRWEYVIKNTLDVIISIAGLILLMPFIIYIALRVKLSSTGPILFKQRRIGKRGREFWIYKFRSMYQEAETNGPPIVT